MSKKIIKHEQAEFVLEPDGFSIHTFELFYRCTAAEWREIKQNVYEKNKKRSKYKPSFIYEEGKGRHVCTKYSKEGIRITLEKNEDDSFKTFFLRLIVNPRKLIDPKSSYLGIFPPTQESIVSLRKAFKRLFKDTVFPNNIDEYKLRRVDLCTNIRCNHNKIFSETIRVMRKLPTPPKYERKLKQHDTKYNKHFLRFHCNTHELIIYDKSYQLYQILDEDQKVSKDGVLRFEVHCDRDYIRNFEKKQSTELETTEILFLLMQESKEKILKHFSQCFDDVAYCRMDVIEQRIRESTYKKKTKDAMLEFATRMRKVSSTDKALSDMKREAIDTDKLLEKFEKLGISPIPLRGNFCAEQIPGPIQLLRQITDGKVTVDYIKVKHK